MYDSHKVMSRAVGVKKPQEAQKTERKSFMIRLAKRTFSGRNKTRLELWEEHLKDPIAALDKALKCVESQY